MKEQPGTICTFTFIKEDVQGLSFSRLDFKIMENHEINWGDILRRLDPGLRLGGNPMYLESFEVRDLVHLCLRTYVVGKLRIENQEILAWVRDYFEHNDLGQGGMPPWETRIGITLSFAVTRVGPWLVIDVFLEDAKHLPNSEIRCLGQEVYFELPRNMTERGGEFTVPLPEAVDVVLQPENENEPDQPRNGILKNWVETVFDPAWLPLEHQSNAVRAKNVFKNRFRLGEFREGDRFLKFRLDAGPIQNAPQVIPNPNPNAGPVPQAPVANPRPNVPQAPVANPRPAVRTSVMDNPNFQRITFKPFNLLLERIQKISNMQNIASKEDLFLMALVTMTKNSIFVGDYNWLKEFVQNSIHPRALKRLDTFERNVVVAPLKNEGFMKNANTVLLTLMGGEIYLQIMNLSLQFGKRNQNHNPNDQPIVSQQHEAQRDNKKVQMNNSKKFLLSLVKNPEIRQEILGAIGSITIDHLLSMNMEDFCWNISHLANHANGLNQDMARKNIWTISPLASSFNYQLRVIHGIRQGINIQITSVDFPLRDLLAPLFNSEELMQLPKLAQLRDEWNIRIGAHRQ